MSETAQQGSFAIVSGYVLTYPALASPKARTLKHNPTQTEPK